jgi:hypothetical protein
MRTTAFRGIVFLLALKPMAIACECAVPPPPSVAYSQTETIFVGTVTEITRMRGEFVAEARMRVNRSYSGNANGLVTLFDSGMCDGPKLEVGQQYVMYIHGPAGEVMPSRGCTRSRNVKDGAEDLEFLNALDKAPAVSFVFGSVFYRQDDFDAEEHPVPGANVALTGPSGTLQAKTNATGQFAFANLIPGHYSLETAAKGYRLNDPDAEYSFDTKPRGSALFEVLMRPAADGRIFGQLVLASGATAPEGILVTLLRVKDRDSKKWPLATEVAVTDGQGKFFFDELVPGFYKILANRFQFPTERAPFLEISWPVGTTEAETVELQGSHLVQECNFHLPPAPHGEKVAVKVVFADGTPAEGAEILVRVGRLVYSDERGSRKTDATGTFTFPAFEGFKYDVSATFRSEKVPGGLHSAATAFSLAKDRRTLTLVLDQPGR